MPRWTTKDILPQTEKVAVVTGSSGGLGYEIALVLAQAGATVVLAARSKAKAMKAVSKIQNMCPDAIISFLQLDLSSLPSILDFVSDFGYRFPKLDILINNAGVMALPTRKLTSDGFELQFGTNHLGHFALTSLLLPYLINCPGTPRVVNVSSLAARRGKINFDDFMGEKKYGPWRAYEQSKLANLLFTFELQRHSDSLGWGLMAIAAHPGWARTDLVNNGPGEHSFWSCFNGCCLARVFNQNAAQGALPILYAAVSESAQPGGYYGPTGCWCNETKGAVGVARIPKAALDIDVAKRLWDESINLTNISWPLNSLFINGAEDGSGASELGESMGAY